MTFDNHKIWRINFSYFEIIIITLHAQLLQLICSPLSSESKLHITVPAAGCLFRSSPQNEQKVARQKVEARRTMVEHSVERSYTYVQNRHRVWKLTHSVQAVAVCGRCIGRQRQARLSKLYVVMFCNIISSLVIELSDRLVCDVDLLICFTEMWCRWALMTAAHSDTCLMIVYLMMPSVHLVIARYRDQVIYVYQLTCIHAHSSQFLPLNAIFLFIFWSVTSIC